MLEIPCGKKLIDSTLFNIADKYWALSFRSEYVNFKFDELEWVSNTAFTFIIGWISGLDGIGISTQISLPSGKDVLSSSYIYEKREYCQRRILNHWQLKERLPKSVIWIDGGIPLANITTNYDSYLVQLPIRKFDSESFELDYDQMYDSKLKSVQSDISSVLADTEIGYFDRNFLNYSILKELYSNVCLHSKSELVDSCFYTVGINKKFKGDSSFVYESRKDELTELEGHFFTDLKGKYRNQDFIELNFIDFGIGIVESLRSKYHGESVEDLTTFLGNNHFTKQHSKQSIENRIIEYGLLLFTSRYELDRNLEIHDFIPRGLYILKELAKKYSGYLEIVSGKGGISLSFKNERTHLRYLSKVDGSFPGTRIRLIFTNKSNTGKTDKGAIYSLSQVNPKFNFQRISFLKLFASAKGSILDISEPNERRIKLLSSLFSSILKRIRSSQKNEIFLFDFAGVVPETADYFSKLVYFLNHCPVSEKNGIIFYNVITNDLNSTVITDKSNELKSKGFFPYPIPCIHVNQSIEWLGIDDKVMSDALTQIWKGNTSKNYFLTDVTSYNNGFIEVFQRNEGYMIRLNIPSFSDIIEELGFQIEAVIEEELGNTGIQFPTLIHEEKNYNKILLAKENTVYLASNGKYLKQYISFNEKLYLLSYRKMIATFFCFKIYNSSLLVGNEALRFNKVLSVTLSSQMIGNEVVKILNGLHDSTTKLISLSSYYSFQDEEGFLEVKKGDKVLMVNDVISTGSLVKNIFRQLQIKEAKPVGFLSIVGLSNLVMEFERIKPICLSYFVLEQVDNLKGESVEVINTVLNTPTSMPRAKSYENVLLDKEEFLNYIDEKYLVIGNLMSNAGYFNYFLNTHDLLSEDKKNNYNLINKLLSAISRQKQEKYNQELEIISDAVNSLYKSSNSIDLTNSIKRLNDQLTEVQNNISPSNLKKFNVDVVFYPFLSSISVFEENLEPFVNSEISESSPLIFPIPRILTKRGWRFSFPPKFLNNIFKQNDLSVLILEDGSLSGATLTQMIDSIGFLSIRSIDVVCLFGRLEDYQKELFSRLRTIQVKGKIVPINVYFGTHLSIPAHSSKESSFQIRLERIRQLETYFNKKNIKASDAFQRYLDKVKGKLIKQKSPLDINSKFEVFDGVSKKDMFILRDYIGRYSSFRLYVEDSHANLSNYLLKNDISILTGLSVLNLEPELYITIRRILPREDIKGMVQKIYEDFLGTPKLCDKSWKLELFIRAIFSLDPDFFFSPDVLVKICSKINVYSDLRTDMFRYIEFVLISVKLDILDINDQLVKQSFMTKCLRFQAILMEESPDMYNYFRFAFRTLIRLSEPKEGTNLINKYEVLRHYYSEVLNNQYRHDDALLPNVFSKLTESISVYNYILLNQENYEETEDKLIAAKDTISSEMTLLSEIMSGLPKLRYIKDIVYDLDLAFGENLGFSTHSLKENIDELNAILLKPVEDVISDLGDKLKLSIENYKNNILSTESSFARFISKSECYLVNEWIEVERAFSLKNSDYIPISFYDDTNVMVGVNPYSIRLAFRNLIENKYKHAKLDQWLLRLNLNDEYTELVIKQESEFKKKGADGLGLSIIPSILGNYGVLYNILSLEPYTIKITFINMKI